MPKIVSTRIVALLLLAVMVLTAVAARPAAAATPRTLEVIVNTRGLEDLGPGWAYEGWLIVKGAPISTGTFTIDSDGRPSETRFPVTLNAGRREVSTFVLTIEPSPDPDPAPSATHVIAGDFKGNRARLVTSHPAALGDSFRTASGRFLLGVPTDQSGATPYTNGIWFVNPAGGPGPSLRLPVLPAGWTYEGWVVGPGGPVSTGTFANPGAADSDAGGPYAGPDAAPPFPGQDFVNPPMSLVGRAAVISVEPVPDNSPAPFAFKPLVKMSIGDPGAGGVLQSLGNNAGSLATGVAHLGRTLP